MYEFISGFSQVEAIKLGLTTNDLLILELFYDNIDMNNLEEYPDEIIITTTYNKIINELPILFNPNKTYESNKKKLSRILNGNLNKTINIEKISNPGYETILNITIKTR